MPGRQHRFDATLANRRLFREVNGHMRDLNERWNEPIADSTWMCECANPGCSEQVGLSVPLFDWLRGEPRHYLVAPGHDLGELEEVVVAGPRFAVTRVRTPLRKPQGVVLHYRSVRPKRFLYVSESAAELMGYPPEAYYEAPELALRTAHPLDLRAAEELCDDEVGERRTLRVVKFDGTVAAFDVRSAAVWAGGERVAVAVQSRFVGAAELEPAA